MFSRRQKGMRPLFERRAIGQSTFRSRRNLVKRGQEARGREFPLLGWTVDKSLMIQIAQALLEAIDGGATNKRMQVR
jgi:hypothetical protein